MKTLSLNSKTKIVSPSLDLKQHASLRACIELSGSGISMALFSAANEWVYLEQFSLKPGERMDEALEYLGRNNEFFQHSYASVFIQIADVHYTLVPQALYDQAQKEQLYRLNQTPTQNDILLNEEVVSAGGYCIYPVDSRVKSVLDRLFPNNHIRHKAVGLADSLPALASRTRKTCLVNVAAEQMDVALYDKKLIFLNSFSFQSAEDFLYFILASMEQNGCVPDDTEIVLAGEVETGSALYHTLRNYIPKIRFAVADKVIEKKNDFVSLPEHFYFSLLNLYLCAL